MDGWKVLRRAALVHLPLLPSEPIADLHWVCMCGCHRRAPSKCKNGARSHAFNCARSGQALDSSALPLPGLAHSWFALLSANGLYGGAARGGGDGGAIAQALLALCLTAAGAPPSAGTGCLHDRHRPHLLRSRSAGGLQGCTGIQSHVQSGTWRYGHKFVPASCRRDHSAGGVSVRAVLGEFRWPKPLQLSSARWPRQFVDDSVRNESR